MGLLKTTRAVRRLVVAALVLSSVPAFVVACFAPGYDEGQFECGPAGDCPPDYTCAADHRWYMHPPDFPDAAQPLPDARRVDALLPPDGALPPDGRVVDATQADAPVVDAAVPDARLPDAHVPPPPDARIPDATPPPPPDARIPDATPPPPPDATPPPPDAAPDASPPSLGDEGLYLDLATRTLDPTVVEYEPAYQLWADGADKRRWIKLPPGTQIDTSDMDHWKFPTGTKFFKQFTWNGRLLETRVITRFGPSPGQVELRAYVWNASGTDATFAPDGAQNVNGTSHDVPSQSTCYFCHEGQAHFVLGFQAVQLSHAGPGVTLTTLAAAGLLSDPPPLGEEYPVPGNAVQSAALGYLHANCGHCHNPTGYPTRTFNIDMDLFVTVASTMGPVELTPPWATTVDQPLDYYVDPPYTTRVVPGDTAASALFHRDSSRGSAAQMPPVASELADADGLTKITAWIDSLP